MSAKKEKRRTSILKKRRSEDREDEPTETVTKIQRRLMFSQKKEVIEFAQCDENVTIWGEKYETSVAKSEGSSEGASTCHRASTDFNSMQVTSHTMTATTTSILIDAEKENIEVHLNPSNQVNFDYEKKRISDETPTINNLSVFVNSGERQRLRESSPSKFNITGMPLDSSVVANKQIQAIVESHNVKVLSPRKTVFINKDFSVIVQDKVPTSLSAIEDNFSLSLEDYENSNRHTLAPKLSVVDMDVSLHAAEKPSTVFKCPQVQKDFNFRKSMNGSPPIKPDDISVQKKEIEDIYDIFMQDTPSKNICCIGTPQRLAKQKALSKVVRKSDNLLHEFGLAECPVDATKSFSDSINSPNFSMDISNDDSVTIENTEELNKKISRLIKNPNATLGQLGRPSTASLESNDALSQNPSSRMTSYDMDDMSVEGGKQQVFIYHDSIAEEENLKIDEISMQQDSFKERPCMTNYEHDMSIDSSPLRQTSSLARKTTFHDTIVEEETETKSQENKRVTTYEAHGMNESVNDTPKKFINDYVEVKNRPTTFEASVMDESCADGKKAVKMNKNRATVFETRSMEVTPIACKSHTTIFDHQNMNVTNKPTISRATTYNIQAMNETEMDLNSPVVTDPAKKSNRATTYDVHSIDETLMENSEAQEIVTKSKNRCTTFQAHSMDESVKENAFECFQKSLHQDMNETCEKEAQFQAKTISRSRATMYNQEQMDLTHTNSQQNMDVSHTFEENSIKIPTSSLVNRKTLCVDESITNITLTNKNDRRRTGYEEHEMEMTQHIDKSLLRRSTWDRESINETGNENIKVTFENKNRATTFEQHAMDESEKDVEAVKSIREESMNITGAIPKVFIAPKSRQTSYHQAEMDINSPQPSMSNNVKSCIKIHQQNGMEFDSPQPGTSKSERITLHQQTEMELSGVEELYDANKSKNQVEIFRDAIFSPPSPFKNFEPVRLSMAQHQTMETSQINRKSVIVQQNSITEDRRKTFTVNAKDDSRKWHNITDADLNMLDDESNPCVVDEMEIECALTKTTTKERISSVGNITKYEDALDDFVNLTIMASPLSMTLNVDNQQEPTSSSHVSRSKRVSRPLSPVRDYNNMLDDLINNLQKKNVPKPRLAIDDYLEKLQIAPIKIRVRPEHEPNAILERIKAKKEEIKKRREEAQKKNDEIEASQFPQIPSVLFLTKNYIECMNERIRHDVSLQITIEPIFPRAIDFEHLLINKFETDPQLSKYWRLDTVFWWMKNLKLTHQKLPFFTLNFHCQQDSSQADESTIPIIFTEVLLYLNENFRHKSAFSRRWKIMMNEFKNAVDRVNNFTSRCSNSNELFTFLDYYHERVKYVFELVEKFFEIVRKYRSVILIDQQSECFIANKMHFLTPNDEGFTEVLDVKIPVYSFIEHITVQDITITGKLFEYEIRPSSNVKSMTGLMLLEYVLFDIEKFVDNNTYQRKIIY